MAAASGHVLLSDVAAAAGVSLATASRALNGQTGVGADKLRRAGPQHGKIALESAVIDQAVTHHRLI